MKILIFAEVYYPDVCGGGEFSTRQMAEALAGKGHDVVVRCLGKSSCNETLNGVRVKRRHVKGLSEHFLSNTKNNHVDDPFTQFDKIMRKWGDLYPGKKLLELYRSVIGKEQPDVVHTVSPMSYMGRYNLWKAAHDLRIPVSHVCRGPNLLELKFLGGKLDAFNRQRNAVASSYLTALAAPSLYMLKQHMAAGIRGSRFNEVIYNAVGLEPAELSEDLMAQKEDMVLYAGEIKKEKGIETLLRAMDGLKNAKLLLIGRGDMADRIRAQASDTGPATELIDWMEREELFAYMRRAKAVVLPSEWEEPFGRILVEAICNGTIAIGSDRGGIPEVLDHDERYIFRSGDARGLRRRMERVLNLSASEYPEEAAGQQKAALRFSDDTFADKWERFFLKQLDP